MAEQRPVVLYIAMSVDGFIADKEGGVGWLAEFEAQGDNGYSDFLVTVDTVIMGRTTYEQLLSFHIPWPYEGKRVYVFTNKEAPQDRKVQFVSGDVRSLVEKERRLPGSGIWIMGGAQLVNEFLREGLVDEFQIAIIPVLLGDGVRLFARGNPMTALELKKTEQFGRLILLQFVKRTRG
jgi:dihydrofolate reductase